jgi:polysaccharide export outer membrane protein
MWVTLASLALMLQVPAAPAGSPSQPMPSPAADYRIGAGDILRIAVYRHADLTQTVVVQNDGTFMFPLIGRFSAADKTTAELERALAEELSRRYLRNPQVSVAVEQYRSKSVYVVGEVARPGTYPLSGSQTLIEVLGLAGPMNTGAADEVVVVRSAAATGPTLPAGISVPSGISMPAPPAGAGDAKAQVLRVSMRAIQSGDVSQNLRLQPNDTIMVPKAPKVYVSGEVRNPGAYPFSPGTTVRQAIGLAGGLTPDGSQSRIRVVRTMDGRSREVKVKLDDPVQPGDTIVVKAKLF